MVEVSLGYGMRAPVQSTRRSNLEDSRSVEVLKSFHSTFPSLCTFLQDALGRWSTDFLGMDSHHISVWFSLT